MINGADSPEHPWQVADTVKFPPALTKGFVLHEAFPAFNNLFDALFFKVALHAVLFQLSDGYQAVDRISCKSADRLGDDEVNLTVQGIGDPSPTYLQKHDKDSIP